MQEADLPALEPLNHLAWRAWALLAGEMNSPLLPALCDHWGVADFPDFVGRLAVIREYQKANK